MTHEAFSSQFLSQLNPQQQEAVCAVNGAVLLLAVPGSGKTTVLITRLAYMIHVCGIPASCILTTTFTNAATKDMQQRYAASFSAMDASIPRFCTIHQLSREIIAYYCAHMSPNKSFQLRENNKPLLRKLYQRVNQEYPSESVIKDVASSISYIKNRMLNEEEIATLDTEIANLPLIYREYCSTLRERKEMDYDDEILYALQFLNAFPALLSHFQDTYPYLCVDEAQDTSKLQHSLIQLLAQKRGNLFMVGDEDQSIYGFRAAYPEALLHFERQFPNAKTLLLEHNYRSSEPIVAAANAFVASNRFRHKKTIRATQGAGEPVQIIRLHQRYAQHQYLCAVAQTCAEETAVLFRNHESALPLISMLERNQISYQYRNSEDNFFSHRVVTDLSAILTFAYMPHNAEAFMRIYHTLGLYLSRDAAQDACTQSARTSKPILEALLASPKLARESRDEVYNLQVLLSTIADANAADALNCIWNQMNYRTYAMTHNLDMGKYETLRMLAQQEQTPRDLLARLEALPKLIARHKNQAESHFMLSTIHGSKGLEYQRVFLLDVFDGTLPSMSLSHTPSQQEVRQYEEERRLFYVAMTRAKGTLYLFHMPRVQASFVDEVQQALPKKELDEDNIMAVFQQDFCEKHYLHHKHGKGTVHAQCGDSLLIEYENGALELRSISQLFEADVV